MKRSAALIPLSHDHHVALEVSLVLRRATRDTATDAVARLRALMATGLDRHFTIEEEVLLPALPADERSPGFADRVRAEHRLIREAVAAGHDDPETARATGVLLHDHIRFEERELFPLVEEHLQPPVLARLGAAIARAANG